ncbi:MAG: GTP pyrophosphokinase family protein [Lachnospirales bacterium]
MIENENDSINLYELQKLKGIKEIFEEANLYYKCALMEVETKYKVLNEQFKLSKNYNPISSMSTRLKSPESIFEKLSRKNLPIALSSLEKINDIAGIRIVCSFIDDIYLLSEYLINQDDITLVKMKDYIKNPKSNGYRSLHLIIEVPIFVQQGKLFVKVEVQLRTIAMEFWANLEHKLWYKKEKGCHTIFDELRECAQISADLDLRMKEIRNKIK